MLDSLSKTMSRSGGLMSSIKEKASTTISSSSSFGSASLSYNNGHISVAGGTASRTFPAQVVFLDDTSHTFEVDKKVKGEYLLQKVFDFLELNEREYFGLIFNDTGGSISSPTSTPDVMRWLDPQKPIRKQLKSFSFGGSVGLKPGHSQSPPTLYFRVKFYVTDPSRLTEEYTRYHLYLQVKHDLLDGRLSAPTSTLCLLTSYVVQSTLGDFETEACRPGYLAAFRELRRLCLAQQQQLSADEIDRRITELHKLHKGQSPAEAEYNFLEHAKRLEMYGIGLHNGKDSSGRDIQLGVTSIGLVVFQNQVKINTFSWSKIVKISFKRKQFFIQLRKELTESYDTLLGFNLASYRSCKNLWKSAVEHHSFFRLHSPKVQPKKLFLMTLGSRFRYSGRTEFQANAASSASLQSLERTTRPLARSTPSRKTLPLTLEPRGNGTPTHQKTGRAPRLASPETSSIGSSIHSNGLLAASKLKPTAPAFPTGSLEQTASASPSTASLAHRAIESFNNKVQSLSTKLPKRAWQDEATSDDEGGFLDPNRRISSLGHLSKSSSQTATPTSVAHRQQPKLPVPLAIPHNVRIPFADDSSTSGQSGMGTSNYPVEATTEVDATISVASFSSSGHGGGHSNSTTQNLRSVASAATTSTAEEEPLVAEESGGGLVIITIYPDEKGRFGFNVKGGADQKLPIIVSRVGANTPADKCYPKLNEGDQVLLINGRDISGHTHDQVVNFIRACSEPHSGHLVLAVKPNAYIGDEAEEPEFQYVPEAQPSSPQLPGTKPLSQSMLLLEESLESGAVIGQFDQLYRRNPSLTISICHTAANVNKNRYRDISPYDSTRVLLQRCPTGDYINANHVVMTIPGCGIINRYIATQGPLSNTCIDFWYMVWESQSSLIAMLTTIVERGRVKCHKYWPDVGEKMQFEGGLEVLCTKEEGDENVGFYNREFEMRLEDEVRGMTQMAYLSWPDHGVPDSPDEFVGFVEQVRHHRHGSNDPVIVHCSAGIGRTGVLILMETALCLVEANQPVYPLDITKQMRDQRASMIQTPSQYKFVCEAILKTYKEGRVKPLPEFCHQPQPLAVTAEDDEEAPEE